MISLLVSLLVVLVILSILWWVIQQIPLPQPIRLAVVVIFALIAIIWLLQFVGGASGLHMTQ
jgi:hypothetical protein